jgi:hypothetical protein
MPNEDEGLFSPADYAQAHYDLNGVDMDDSTRDGFKAYQWEHGEYSVTSEYAPENEETRVYFIVTLHDNELMRCNLVSGGGLHRDRSR